MPTSDIFNDIYYATSSLVANTTTKCYIAVPKAQTIESITTKFRTACASSAGTVVLSVAAGGNNLLSASTVDMESQGTTETVMTLTSTAADLAVSAMETVTFSIVSDNVDATAGLDFVAKVVFKTS